MRAYALLLLCSCTRPPEAPEDLGGVARFLHRVHGTQDDAAAAGLARLEALLDGVGRSTPFDERHWELPLLDESDVADLPKRPDRALDGLIGSAVAAELAGTLECYARLQTIADQRPMEPTAKSYVREMLSDPTCFLAGECALQTRADAVRSTIVLEATFVQWKNFRWVAYERDGVKRRAFYARSWLQESADASGGSRLWQNYGVDVYIPREDGVLRFFAVWSESDVYLAGALVDDATELATIAGATEGVFRAGNRMCP